MTLCIIASAIGLDAQDINGDSSPFLGSYAIGRYAGGFYSPPDIAEIIIYNRLLTSQEREGVEAYLDLKWLNPTAVPEPSTYALFLAILAVLFTPKRTRQA